MGGRHARAGNALQRLGGIGVNQRAFDRHRTVPRRDERPGPEQTDAPFARVLGMVLRSGVIVSAAIVLWGGIEYLLRYGGVSANYTIFRGEPADLRLVGAIIDDASRGSARGLIQLGVLVLIATPVARVAFSIAGFVRQRDWLYAAAGGLVLGLLTYALTAR
jgi:uncharacterized membrane protein